VTAADLGRPETPAQNARFVTIGVIRPAKDEQAKRFEYTVPVEHGNDTSAALSGRAPAHN
jgi:hypothetical protein